MSRKYYIFQVYTGGYGETVKEAWADAVENTELERMELPEVHSMEAVEEDDE